MLAKLKRAFSPLDTSEVDAAIERAEASHRGVYVRARALSMDVACGDAKEAVGRVVSRLGTSLTRRLQAMHHIDGDLPADMRSLVMQAGRALDAEARK